MTPERLLVVNADDFGLSPGVNRGIVEAHERGIVTSASLMVRHRGAAADAAAYARARPSLSLGLHLDLGEWACRDGSWEPLYEVVPLGDDPAVRSEITRQLAAFRRLAGRDPTHLDSHQHVHLQGPAQAAAKELARSLGVPLRRAAPGIRYVGGLYTERRTGVPAPGAITVERLVEILGALEPGVTELACHPGAWDDSGSPYGRERIEERRVLCDPRARRALAREGIRLVSFAEAWAGACAAGTAALEEARGRGPDGA